jgi:hypothetical protein
MVDNHPAYTRRRKSSRLVSFLLGLLLCAIVLVLAAIPLLAIVAKVVEAVLSLPALMGEAINAFFTCVALLAFIAYSILLLHTGDWSRLILLLPALIEWLRSAKLL